MASKVAGDDNGFSFNTALNTNYNFMIILLILTYH